MENTLTERRTERGWSQARLAEILEVSRQTVISLEKGRFDPALPLAGSLYHLFDCPIEDIITPEDWQPHN